MSGRKGARDEDESVRSGGRKKGARKVRGGEGRVGSERTTELAKESEKRRRTTLSTNGLIASERMDLGLAKGGKYGANESPRYGLVQRSNEVGKVRRPVRRARGRLRSEFERSMTRVDGASCGIAVLRLRLADSRSLGRLRPAPLPNQSVSAEWRGGVSLRVGHPPSVLSERDRAIQILSAANSDFESRRGTALGRRKCSSKRAA